MRHAFRLGALMTFAFISSSRASTSDVLPLWHRDVRCMVDVLQKNPRVDHVKSRAFLSGGWIQAFVQYRCREDNGPISTVRFIAYRVNDSRESPHFEANLNGIFTPGTPGPPDLGTTELAKLWRSQCHVIVSVLYI